MTNTGFHSYRNRQVRTGGGAMRSSFVGVLVEDVGSGSRKGFASHTTFIRDVTGNNRFVSRLVFCHPTKGVKRSGFVYKSQQAKASWG